jgi:Fe-S cluster assembly protein SufD
MLQERLRQNALQYYQQRGLPSRKDEAWHYTSMKEFNVDLFSARKEGFLSARQKKDLVAFLPKDALRIVLVDGLLSKDDSDLKALAKVLDISFGFKGSVIQRSQVNRQSVGPVEQDVFEALNTAQSRAVLNLNLPKNGSLKSVLAIISIVTQKQTQTAPKIYLNLENGSKLTLLEVFCGSVDNCFQNSVVEGTVRENAKLEYLRYQDDSQTSTNLGRARFFVDKNARLECLTVGLGARLARHSLEIFVRGENASAVSHGLYLTAGEQHHDHHLHIDHVVGHCNTIQHYKGVLAGKSKAIFDGKVRIRKSAQKASSEQLNNNLVLSQFAEADSKPQLEIAADDVKATHGSTVGQLQDDEMFYLLSRGIPRPQAEEMLSVGFLEDLVLKVSHPVLRAWLKVNIQKAYRNMRQS